MAWHDFVRDFQELIGVAVGFAGVIITLLYTAKQARDQRQHEAELARRQRQQETLELGRGLLVELSQMRANILKLATIEFTEDDKDLKAVMPLLKTPIFDANVQQIGRLPASAAPIVVSAYLQIQRLCQDMRFQSQDQEAQHYLRIPVPKMGHVQDQCGAVGERLTQAIDTLMAALGDHGLPVEPLRFPSVTSQ